MPRVPRRAESGTRAHGAAQERPPLPLPPSGAEHKTAKTDSPVFVVVEATIVELALKPGTSDAGVNLARLGGTATQPGTIEQAALNARRGFNPAAVLTDGKPARAVAGKIDGLKSFAFFNGSVRDALRSLESMGEPRILACPRLMILDKQSGDVQIGQHLPYQEVTSKGGVTTATYKPILIGTELHVRPFVAADGKIRLEVQASRTTGHLDAAGIPQINTCQVSTNVVMQDGTMLAMCDRPRAEVEQRTHRTLNVLSFLPGPLSLLGWIQNPNLLSYTVVHPARKQTVVLLSSHIVRNKGDRRIY